MWISQEISTQKPSMSRSARSFWKNNACWGWNKFSPGCESCNPLLILSTFSPCLQRFATRKTRASINNLNSTYVPPPLVGLFWLKILRGARIIPGMGLISLQTANIAIVSQIQMLLEKSPNVSNAGANLHFLLFLKKYVQSTRCKAQGVSRVLKSIDFHVPTSM
jgi:hypothetical protein